jgi:hypothetical protein
LDLGAAHQYQFLLAGMAPNFGFMHRQSRYYEVGVTVSFGPGRNDHRRSSRSVHPNQKLFTVQCAIINEMQKAQ